MIKIERFIKLFVITLRLEMVDKQRISPEQVVLDYKTARRDGDTQRGADLINAVIRQTREHKPGHIPEFSHRLDELMQKVGIQGIFDMAETWGDLTVRIGSSPTDKPQKFSEKIRLEPIPYIIIPAVTAVVGLLAGGIAFRDVKIIEVPSQQVSIDSPYAIKRSPSGRTAYQIFDPYQKTGKEMSRADLADYLALVGGRLSQK